MEGAARYSWRLQKSLGMEFAAVFAVEQVVALPSSLFPMWQVLKYALHGERPRRGVERMAEAKSYKKSW